MSLRSIASVLVFGIATTVAAHATPITGQFSITGSSVSDSGTALTFIPNSIAAGAANTLTGDFKTLILPLEPGTITQTFSYSPYVAGSGKFSLTGSNGDTISYVINSLSEQVLPGFTLFTGQGVVSTNVAGFDPTMANLLFSAQGNGSVTFSATSMAASPVPEPSTLALLGTGLVGAAGAIRRRLTA